MAHRGPDEAGVVAHHAAVGVLVVLRRAQEIGGDYGRNEACDQEREQNRDRDREAELAEILPGDAAHEAHRREDRGDRQRDGDDGEADLVGSLHRGAPGRLSHAHVAHDVLDLDDGVVDQNAGDERDREQAHEVERKAERIHRPESRDDRQWKRERGDDGRPDVPQEDEHDDDGERRALDQRLHRRMVVAELAHDLGVDLGEGHFRMRGLDFRQALRDPLVDCHVARAFGAGDPEGDDRLIEQTRERARLRGAVDDRSELVETHLASARQRDRQRRELGDAARAGEGADRLLLAGHLAAAAAEIDIVGAHLLVDRCGGYAEREQLFRLERDPDLPVDAAEALHLADAADALEVARHGVVDEPGELLDRHHGRRGRVGDDRKALDIDAADDRFVDGARQVAADLGDLVLHVVERAVDVDRADVELDDGRRRAVGDRRDDMPDAVEAGDGVLDLLRNLRLELAGAAPDWEIATRTIGMSMLGKRVIGIERKLTIPKIVSTANATIAGMGRRIDQPEILRAIAVASLGDDARSARQCATAGGTC